jgi:glycosyltransferase involved in cell wall biosynthesis
VRVAYFVSHPIQYQAPLLRRIAQEPDIELKVFYFSDFSVRGYADAGFGGVQVQWDVPLLDGYRHEFLPGFLKKGTYGIARPLSYGIFSRLREGKFDAVWVHGYHTVNAWHVMMAAKLLGIPVLLRTDSTLIDRARSAGKLAVKKFFLKVLRRMTKGVLSVGSGNSAYWRASFGETFPIFLMPYAVDNEYFRNRAAAAAPAREELRRALGLEPGRPVFLFASKLRERKRCIDLVEAYLRLSPGPGAEPPGYLLIAGDGEERAAVERRINEAGVTHVRLLGFQNQSVLPRLFDLCDVFVLPSIYEPWGLIVNEVMNAGRAVVVSDQVGCAPDLVRDGQNGFVFPARDVDALSGVLRRFLEDPKLAGALGKRAAETIATHGFEQNIEGLRQALAFVAPNADPGFTVR